MRGTDESGEDGEMWQLANLPHLTYGGQRERGGSELGGMYRAIWDEIRGKEGRTMREKEGDRGG